MHAGVNYIQVQPGKMDELISMFRDSVVPTAPQQQGNRGGFLLTDRNTDKAIALGLWETEADIPTDKAGGWYQEQVSKFAQLIAGPVVRDLYEVSVQVAETSGRGETRRARVATAQVQPGKMDELISILRDTNYPAYRPQQGFKGALLLTDSNTGNGISILLWETETDIKAGEASSQERRQRLQATTIEPPVVEYYEVSVQM